MQNFNARATAPAWAETVEENGAFVVADALANAKRRMDEHRYTDLVLRSYRAAECATQMRLLKIGIHPSRPSACQSAYQRYAPPDRAGELGLAFDQGLQFLQSAGEMTLSLIEKSVRALQNARNHTYLEHGYVRVQRGQCERCFDWSLDICAALLGPAIRQIWRDFRMQM